MWATTPRLQVRRAQRARQAVGPLTFLEYFHLAFSFLVFLIHVLPTLHIQIRNSYSSIGCFVSFYHSNFNGCDRFMVHAVVDWFQLTDRYLLCQLARSFRWPGSCWNVGIVAYYFPLIHSLDSFWWSGSHRGRCSSIVAALTDNVASDQLHYGAGEAHDVCVMHAIVGQFLSFDEALSFISRTINLALRSSCFLVFSSLCYYTFPKKCTMTLPVSDPMMTMFNNKLLQERWCPWRPSTPVHVGGVVGAHCDGNLGNDSITSLGCFN